MAVVIDETDRVDRSDEQRDYPLFDADAHICEPPAVWTDYVEEKYKDLILQVRVEADGTEALWIEGERNDVTITQACVPGAYSRTDLNWDDILQGSFDPATRIDVLGQEGLDQAVVFPSVHLLSGDIVDAKVAAANARAYNNWIADFVGHDRDRLHAVGVCPLQDVDEAVTEIERIAGLGLTGITFRPERYNGMALYDDEMDRVWSACEASGLVIGIHGSFGSRMQSLAKTRYRNPFFVHMVCHPFEQMAAVLDIIAGGVLDQHRTLRIGFFESGLGWLPYWLNRMDEHKESMGSKVPALTREPTEIFREQCFITMESDEGAAFAQLVEAGLEDNVMWGSDYPHYDCTYPNARGELDETFAQVPGLNPELRRKVMHDNPRRFLGLS